MSCTCYLSLLSFTSYLPSYPSFPRSCCPVICLSALAGSPCPPCYINFSCWCFVIKQEEKASPGRKTCRRSACCRHYKVLLHQSDWQRRQVALWHHITCSGDVSSTHTAEFVCSTPYSRRPFYFFTPDPQTSRVCQWLSKKNKFPYFSPNLTRNVYVFKFNGLITITTDKTGQKTNRRHWVVLYY